MQLFMEQDGTLLAGYDTANYNLISLEETTAPKVPMPIHFLTQYNYGKLPNTRKDGLSLIIDIDTNNYTLNFNIYGLSLTGEVLVYSGTLHSTGLQLIDLSDMEDPIIPVFAYIFEIFGSTDTFTLNYIALSFEPRPSITKRTLVYPSNLGKANKKKLSVWPLLVDTLADDLTISVVCDGTVLENQVVKSSGIQTLYWRNTLDFAAVDWGIELYTPTGMELFKIMPPEILQVFPMGKLIDQIGPIDFNAQGLVYGIRLRVLNEGTILHYKVYDADVLVLEDDLITTVNVDQAYIIPFPKGIDPAVCRIVFTSTTVFYRFSCEFKVRTTGKESESKFIKI